MNRLLAGISAACVLGGLLAIALSGCDYERLPKKFELVQGPDEPGLTVMYSEAMRDPANAKFPPVTVRLVGVTADSMPGGKLDIGNVVDAASKPSGPVYYDISLNQNKRLVVLAPTDPIFASPKVLAIASVAWAEPEEGRENYVERVGIFDEQGREISQYVALPPPPPSAKVQDRRAVLLSSDVVKRRGMVIEVDRQGVKALPAGLKVREARATEPEESK